MMTLTTVGYELHPATFAGKLTGGLCALLGVFILTLPIPIVVNSFASYYKNRWDTHPPHTHCGQQLRLLLQEQVGYSPSPYPSWSTASPLTTRTGGILTLSIPILVNSFASYYKNRWDTYPAHTHCGLQLCLLLQEQVGYYSPSS